MNLRAIFILITLIIPWGLTAEVAAPLPEAEKQVQLERAKQLAETGFSGLQASQPQPGQLVESALAFSEALRLFESLGDLDQAREMQANIFWCKKRMTLDDVNTYAATKKASDPQIDSKLDELTAIAERKIPVEQADEYLAQADRYAAANPEKSLQISIRYFEVAERFFGSLASVQAQRKSLDYQTKAQVNAPSRETLFAKDSTPPTGRKAVPEAAQLKKAKDSMRSLFKDVFADRSEAGKRALPNKLFTLAQESKDDLAMQYSLLREALDLSVTARDVANILTYSDSLSAGFEGVDATAERRANLGKIKADPVAAAALTLIEKPGDKAAYVVLGKYYCFTKDNFQLGLPMLAEGADAALAKLAEMELAKPQGAPQQMELGDAWYAQGTARTPQGIVIWKRAMHWYDVAVTGLQGANKERVSQRIQDMFPTVIPANFDWSKLTGAQWAKLKEAPIVVAGNSPKVDSGIALKAGQKARVIANPDDTWLFHDWFSGEPISCGASGFRQRRMRMDDDLPTGALSMWVDTGKHVMSGVIAGPGKIMLAAVNPDRCNKGSLRVKVLLIND